MQLPAFTYVLFVAGAISLSIAVLCVRRRHSPGAWPLALINVAGAIWACTTAIEIAASSYDLALLVHRLSFIGMDVLGVAWFAFAAQYTGRTRWVTLKSIVILSLLPVATQILVWTNQFHGLVYKSVTAQADGIGGLQKVEGIWWWIDSAYSYALLAVGLVAIIALFVRGLALYRRQIAALMAAALVPIAADAVYTYGLANGEPVNLAPAAFAWVGLVLYWGFTRYQLMDVTPVAREFVVRHLSDTLLVTDPLGRVTYLNLAAEKLLGVRLSSVAGMDVAQVMEDSPGLLGVYERAKGSGSADTWGWEHEDRYYDAGVSTVQDSRGHVRGHVLVLRDTSAHKAAEVALEEARRDLEHRVRVRTTELAREKENLSRLNRLAVKIARCSTSKEVLDLGVQLACESAKSTSATMWVRLGNDKSSLVSTEDFSPNEKRQLKRFLASSAAIMDALESGNPICLNGFEAPASLESACRPDLAKITVIPLISRSEGLGVLCLASPTLDYCETEDSLSLARAIASQLAVALENTRRYEDARFQAERDSLTGLLNHRGISKRLEQEVARCDRSGAVLGLVMIDVDNFKLFNDAYGHAVGDKVLQGLAGIMSDLLRRSDAVGRYGGDEFIAVLPDSDTEATVALAERMREALESTPLFTDGDRKVPIKMSYGVATLPDDGQSPGDLLAAADVNLYRSKQRGGDLITASVNDDDFRPASIGAFSVLDGLVTSVDNKDHYTRQHSEDVTVYAVALAARMGLSTETQRTLRVASLLHDIGKIGIPDHILRKPADLTDDEQEIIKNHVMLGELIIHGIPGQEEVVGAVGSHHERFDGKGYPRGLSGERIPLLGRILAAADAYSAMTTDRPYGKGLPPEEAKAELRRSAGTQLDPEVTTILLEYLRESKTQGETEGETSIAASAIRRF